MDGPFQPAGRDVVGLPAAPRGPAALAEPLQEPPRAQGLEGTLQALQRRNEQLKKKQRELEQHVEGLKRKYALAGVAWQDLALCGALTATAPPTTSGPSPAPPPAPPPAAARLREAFLSLQFSSVLCDPALPDCPVTLVSSGFCRLTGYPPWEVIGRNCRLVQCPQTDPAVIRQMGDYVRAVSKSPMVRCAEELVVRVLNRRQDGSLFWNLLHISPLVVSSRPYLIGVCADVSHLGSALDAQRAEHRAVVSQVVSRLFELGDLRADLGL